MAKTRLIIFTLLLGQMLCATVITIGSGNTLHQGLPIEPLARFSYTQQIFLATEIGCSGTITSIGFQYHVLSNIFYNTNKNWTIYLGYTDQSELSGWLPINGMTAVFDGLLNQDWFSGGLPGSGWLVIPLSTAFAYNGNQNLVVAVDENTDAAGNSGDDFYCSSMSNPRGISFQSMSVNPDPAAPPATFQLKNYFSNLMLSFDGSETPDAPQNLYGYFDGNANRLFWSAPSTPGVLGYRINRNGTLLQDCTATSHDDTDVIAGFTYQYSIQARYAGNVLSAPSNLISITVPMGGDNCVLYEGFEACEAFSSLIPRFTNLDLDGSSTWDWQDISFPGEGNAMGWITFVPAQTDPPLTTISPAQGNRMLMAMSSTTPPNNDWLISPRLNPGTNAQLSFQARSATAAYGLERLRILIGTDINNLNTFSPLHTESYQAVPALWTEYQYDLSAFAGQSIYLAWQCVSLDAFALFVDEIMLTGSGGYLGSEDNLQIPLPYRNYPNPARGGTFQIKAASDPLFDLSIYNTRGQMLHAESQIKSFDSRLSGLKLLAGVYLIKLESGGHKTVLRQV
ncbi:MAG TPA: choice-of-anchor J domain-containing protein, partial [Candidatus Cloacimonadota bacterium]|nr:choice-of-anchor J domain-containing protein [Candidatus Cloacimonadota bacterium]